MIRIQLRVRGVSTLPQEEPDLPAGCRKSRKNGEAVITYQKG